MASADATLAEASGKFQEAAALALFNWGNVHMCAARKAMDGGRDPGGGAPGAAIATADKFDEVTDRLAQAQGRYLAALEVKPDFHDASIALAQRRYERARLLCAAAGLSAATTSGSVDSTRADEAEAEFDAACADFTTVLAQLPEEEKKEKPKEAPKEGEAPADEPSMKAQVLVMWGNTLFEHSQMRARLSKEWKSTWTKPWSSSRRRVRAGGHRPGAQGAPGRARRRVDTREDANDESGLITFTNLIHRFFAKTKHDSGSICTYVHDGCHATRPTKGVALFRVTLSRRAPSSELSSELSRD